MIRIKKKVFPKYGKIIKKKHFFFKKGNLENTAKIYLNKSYTNIYVTLTDLHNKVIICKSSGNSGIFGSKRRKIAYQAIELIIRKLSVYLKLYNIITVIIILKIKINPLLYFLLKELIYYNIIIKEISLRRPKAFNGVRGRKMRRI